MDLYERLKTTRVEYELSVLICTLKSRQDKLNRILTQLNQQIKGRSVQILWLGDNKSMTVGEKRNMLLIMASGRRVCFIDDDDYVADIYLDEIFKLIPQDPEVITFDVMRYIDGKEDKPQRFSKDYSRIRLAPDMSFYKMPPNHLCVWKRGVIKEEFPKKSLSEDHVWAENMLKHYTNQVNIDKVLYYYDYSKKWSETH